MKRNSRFYRIVRWLGNTELFFRPSRQIPGRWELYEYYSEPAGELLHVKEDQLKRENQFWKLNFGSGGNFSQQTNLPVPFLKGMEYCKWSTSKGFVFLRHPETCHQAEAFRFAVEKGILKLLKKDKSGRIEIFGFFRRPEKNNGSK
jgi:hypothetical protein